MHPNIFDCLNCQIINRILYLKLARRTERVVGKSGWKSGVERLWGMSRLANDHGFVRRRNLVEDDRERIEVAYGLSSCGRLLLKDGLGHEAVGGLSRERERTIGRELRSRCCRPTWFLQARLHAERRVLRCRQLWMLANYLRSKTRFCK